MTSSDRGSSSDREDARVARYVRDALLDGHGLVSNIRAIPPDASVETINEHQNMVLDVLGSMPRDELMYTAYGLACAVAAIVDELDIPDEGVQQIFGSAFHD